MNTFFLKNNYYFNFIQSLDADASITETTKTIHRRCVACDDCSLNEDYIMNGFLLSTKLSKKELRDYAILVSSPQDYTILM